MPELMVDLVRLRLIENGLASLASKATSIQRGLSSASPDPAVAGRRSIGMRLTRANQRMIELERRLRSVQTFTAQAAGQYDAAVTKVERRAVIEHGTSVVIKRYAGTAGGASGKTLSPEQLAALSLLGQLALAAVQGSLQWPAMLGAMVAGGGASRKNSGSQGLYIPDHLANEVLGRYTEDEHSAYVYKLPDGTVLPVDVNKASELIGQFNQISNEQIMGYAEVMTDYSEAVPAFLAFAAEQGYDVRTFLPDGHSAINDYYIQLRSVDIAIYEEAYAKPFREQLLQGASTTSDLIPIVGTIKGVIEVVSGRDPVTGKSLSAGERTISAVFTLASLLPVTGIMKTAFKPFTKNADTVPDIDKQVDEVGIGGTGSGVPKNKYSANSKNHLIKPEGVNKTGLSGGHNAKEFFDYLDANGIPYKVENMVPHPSVPGVYDVYYKIAKQEGGVYTSEFKASTHKKTVYDETVFTDEQMYKYCQEAMDNGTEYLTKGGQQVIQGIASNGLKFEGWINPTTGEIESVYPVLEWNKYGD